MRNVKQISGHLVITFFLPIVGLFFSLTKLNWMNRKLVLIMFVTLYGSIIPLDGTSDGVRLQQNAYNYVGMHFSEFITILYNLVLLKPIPGYPSDIYIHSVYYLVSGVFATPVLFFPVVSFVFAYFFISGLEKVLYWNRKHTNTFLASIFIILLVIFRGVDSMQSVRTWTGMWVLFNGVYGYFSTKRKKYLYLMMAAPLFHFAFVIIAMPAYLSVLFHRLSPKLYIGIYILSFIINLNPGNIVKNIEHNELGEKKLRGYYNEEYDPVLERLSQQNNVWYAKYGRTDSVYIGGNAIAILLIFSGYYRKRMTYIEANLFTVGLMMASLANFGDFIYTFYSRTMANAVLYFLSTIVLITSRTSFHWQGRMGNSLIKVGMWLCVLIFIPKIVYTVANTLIYTSIYIIGLPIIGLISPDSNVSLRDILGWII